MMPIIHEEVVEALAHAMICDAPGFFDVAAEGVLPRRRVKAATEMNLIQ